MGNLGMPKHSADLADITAVLDVYNRAGSWLDNETFINRMKAELGSNLEPQAYTKKTQIPSYFGFTEWENPESSQSKRRITESGKRFYHGLVSGDDSVIFAEIMESLSTRTFGRNVCGVDSDSDLEPPNIFIKAALALGYLTRQEYGFLLWRLNDFDENILDIFATISINRIKGGVSYSLEPKYADIKPLGALINWGFLVEDKTQGRQGRVSVNPKVIFSYLDRLSTLRVFNTDSLANTAPEFNNSERITGAKNVIYFGSPGTGKSYRAKTDFANAQTFTTLFHPEYTYSDFVGSYRPVIGHERDQPEIDSHDGGTIAKPVNYFEFVPGPLVNALTAAFENPGKSVCLLIDELNRGECAAIFGDIFQLLDRDEVGTSEYGITIKAELRKYFTDRQINFDVKKDGKLYLPSNLSLVATMNTSDQSLYPIDAAFKRRWDWIACPINFDELKDAYPNQEIFMNDGHEKWSWESLITVINKYISKNHMEDKQIGPWFLRPSSDGEINYDVFLNKCLFYLWHDVYKDDQDGDDSPFIANDQVNSFGTTQVAMRAGGLKAGFKNELISSLGNESK
jgi:5-methylcytosine-specific restriction enzyme B